MQIRRHCKREERDRCERDLMVTAQLRGGKFTLQANHPVRRDLIAASCLNAADKTRCRHPLIQRIDAEGRVVEIRKCRVLRRDETRGIGDIPGAPSAAERPADIAAGPAHGRRHGLCRQGRPFQEGRSSEEDSHRACRQKPHRAPARESNDHRRSDSRFDYDRHCRTGSSNDANASPVLSRLLPNRRVSA